MTTASGNTNGIESPATSDRVAPSEGATTKEFGSAPETAALLASAPTTHTAVGNATPNTQREVSVTIPGLSQTLHGIDHELQLLSRTHKFDWVSKRLLVLRNVIIASLLVLVTILIVVVAISELTKKALVINGFDVPTSLEERGFTSRVLGKKLVDQMTLIRSQTLTRLSTRDINPSVWKSDADLTIAESKLTVGAVFAYVRGLLGRDTYVDGELMGQGSEVALTVRIRGNSHKTIVGNIDDLDGLMLKAAEHIMLESHPFIVGQFRYFNKDIAGALQAVTKATQSDNPEEVAEGLHLWGTLLLAKGDRTGAFVKWEESILASPKTSRAEESIVFALRTQGRRDEATKRLERRAALYPNDPYVWGMLGEGSFDVGDLVAVERFSQKALALNPQERVAMMNQNRLLIVRGDYQAALAVGDQMMRLVTKTQDPEMRSYAMGAQLNALLVLREFDRARSVVETYLAVDPLGPQGHYRQAVLLNSAHEYDEALVSANKAITLGSLHSHGARIIALIGKGELDAAQREAERHVKRVPALGLRLLGEIHIRRGQPARAAEIFREVIKQAPQHAAGYTGLGRALALQRDDVGAEEQFKKAGEINKRDGALFYWGEMLAAKGDFAGAIKKYEEALIQDPKWGEPYAKWGESLVALGNADAAKEKFAKALELEPKHPDFQKYKTKF